MKKTAAILLSLAIAMISATSCAKIYVEKWDSLYYTDEYGQKQCRMLTNIKLNNDPGSTMTEDPFSMPIAVYYSGKWTAVLKDGCTWGFLDRNDGEGVHYLHFIYMKNDSGQSRSAIMTISCDNGESVDITLYQE